MKFFAIILIVVLSHTQGLILNLSLYARCKGWLPSKIYSAEKTLKNLKMVESIREIPLDKSVCYLTARGVSSFVSARPHIWRYPEKQDADFVMIQNNVDHVSFYDTETGRICSSGGDCSIKL